VKELSLFGKLSHLYSLMKSSNVENLRNAKCQFCESLKTILFFFLFCFDDFLLMRCSPYSSKIGAKSDLSSSCHRQVERSLLMTEDTATPLM